MDERGEDLGNNSDQSTSSENSIKRRGRNESENEFHDESPKIDLETHLTQRDKMRPKWVVVKCMFKRKQAQTEVTLIQAEA